MMADSDSGPMNGLQPLDAWTNEGRRAEASPPDPSERFFGGGDEILALLTLLPAREVAKMRAVSATLRVMVDAFIDELVVERGWRCRALGQRRLCEMARFERAILFEDFGFGWRARWKDGPTAQGVGDVRYEHIEVREMRELRDDAPELELAPVHFLSIRGGGMMNFNGLYKSFATPVKPRRLSFLARASERSNHRTFANVFLSSGPLPHGAREPVPTFYMSGAGQGPPEPPDLFTVLIDLMRRPGAQEERSGASKIVGAVWLPTGAGENLLDADHRHDRAWRQIELTFDWAAGTLRTDVRALPLRDGASRAPPRACRFLTPDVAGGFTHVYLFTWSWRQGATGARAQCSEIQLADLWLEP